MRRLLRARRWFLTDPEGSFRQYQLRRHRRYTLGDVSQFTTPDEGGGTPILPIGPMPWDDVEDYSVGVVADDSLFGGENGPVFEWTSYYRLNTDYFGVNIQDDAESYTAGNNINGLNGGQVYGSPTFRWTAAFTTHDGYFGVVAHDDAEDYTNGQDLSGLNGGTGIRAGAYVSIEGYFGIRAFDNAEDYTATDPINGLNGGTGIWDGAFVAR